MNQSFSTNEFLKLVRTGDYKIYFPDKNLETKKKLLEKIENQLEIDSYEFKTIKKRSLNEKEVYVLDKLKKNNPKIENRISDDFILRKINNNICRVYGIHQADRYNIVKVIRNILENNKPCFILKADIRNFYETINKDKIIKLFKSSSLLSFDTKYLLENLFNNEVLSELKGLPRGICISASLSEYYMKKFDEDVKKFSSIFYYARYVDDIIIFSTMEIKKNEIQNLLDPMQLTLNHEKTKTFNTDTDVEFDFLGYKFKKKSKDSLEVLMATKKVNKIKTKMIKAFLDYKKNNNFKLLYDRILFLKVNYPIKRPSQTISLNERHGSLHGGLAYNYPLINSFDNLIDLDRFLDTILFSKEMTRLNKKISLEEKHKLKKITFKRGFFCKILRTYSLNKLDEITQCWRG